MSTDTTLLTELKGGLIVATQALVLAVDLGMRGHTMTAKDGALVVAGGARLSLDDRQAIKRHRWHLLAIAEYQA